MKKSGNNFYVLKQLGLIIFGLGGIFLIIDLIKLAFSQKSILLEISIGLLVILLVPFVNVITGIFDDSVPTNPTLFWENYKKVLLSLIFSLLFVVLIMPIIALQLLAVFGIMAFIVCVVGLGIYFIKRPIDSGINPSVFLLMIAGIIIYEILFIFCYSLYKKNEEKIWDKIRSIFNK